LVVPEDAVMDTGTMQMAFVDAVKDISNPGIFRWVPRSRDILKCFRTAGGGNGGYLGQLPHRFGEPAQIGRGDGRAPTLKSRGRGAGKKTQGESILETGVGGWV